MATILAHIRVKPGAEEQFEQMARELYAATHANETAVRRYEYWRGAPDRTYYTLLSFDDFHGFLDHQASDHHETGTSGLGDLLEDFRLEWLDPIGAASPLVPTEMQDETPTDASDLWRAYRERMPAEVQDWWLPLR